MAREMIQGIKSLLCTCENRRWVPSIHMRPVGVVCIYDPGELMLKLEVETENPLKFSGELGLSLHS